jgi:signal transduction histidine kinase
VVAAGAALAAGALLSGCGARSSTTSSSLGGGSLPGVLWWIVSAVAVVLFAVLAGMLTKRRTARPLVHEQRRGERERAALTAERDVLLRERDGFRHEREQREGRLRAASADLDALSAERERLRTERDALAAERDAAAGERDRLIAERDELLGSVDATFVNLAMRTLTLVERQLVLIESLEGQEADPDQLENLFRLDHLATRMRRNSENMLLLAGLENSRRGKDTVSLLDVVRAAVSEIERYERVKLGFLPYALLAGAAADDTSHLLAELLENATAFSPPQDKVEVGAWRLDNGELMLSVTDRGIGMPAEKLRDYNEQLAAPEDPGGSAGRLGDEWLGRALTGRSMGLFVVARLARRHGVRVQLRENAQGGGVTAMVVVPRNVLRDDPAASVPSDLDEQRRAEREVAAAAAEIPESRSPLDASPDPVGRSAPRPVRDDPRDAAESSELTELPELPELPRRSPGGEDAADQAGARRGRHHRPAEPEPPAEPADPAPEALEAGEARHARRTPEPTPAPTSDNSTVELIRRRPGASGATAQMPNLPPVPGPAPDPAPEPPEPPESPEPPEPPTAPGGAAPAAAEVANPPAAQADSAADRPSGSDRPEQDSGGLPVLPRRVPRSGEAPASAPSEPGELGTPSGAQSDRPKRATSAAELRSRLGGFQSGLRRAAAETIPEGGTASTGTGATAAARTSSDAPGVGTRESTRESIRETARDRAVPRRRQAEDAGSSTPAEEQHSTTPGEEEHG